MSSKKAAKTKAKKPTKKKTAKYLVFDNPDKKDSSAVTAGELAWPWRHCMVGPPGSGKRVLLLNVLKNMERRPDRIVCIHLDPNTHEYDKIADEIHTVQDGFDFSQLGGEHERTLLILDEIPWNSLKRAELDGLTSLFRYGSTHRNCSVALLYQTFKSIPNDIRRMCSAFSAFPGVDKIELPHFAKSVGIDEAELRELMTLTRGRQESITIDTSVPGDHPFRYRLCFIWPVKRKTADAPLGAGATRAEKIGGAIVVVPPPSDLPEPMREPPPPDDIAEGGEE